MIVDLYSKRKKRAERNNQPEVYQYDSFPITFRNQVIHIWLVEFSPEDEDELEMYSVLERSKDRYWYWKKVYNTLARELGLPHENYSNSCFNKCQEFLLDENTPVDNILDIVELTFQDIEEEDHIYELNHRFREHGLGYQFENGKIIRIDSQFIHSEVVLKTLSLLSHPDFEGAEEEFYKAHEFYRKGEYKEAIANALKAFESTMKTICEQCGWKYDKNSPAKKLIDVIFKNELIPSYLQSHFTHLRCTLEDGVPTVRNKTSGHGQGTTPIQIPDYLASYALHLTATNIVMLVEAYKSQK